ncbi:hypothetical protein GUJ93_ZPchr0005g15177 [Zizania palustris]|uniref:Uncharacterized protein n=1 Tax=Zizania palustris TaxID=103762 RepID=A0A8J5SMG5_ZIZPA|nr:hypothetical protein GUJ93_ZPchr0005g15177 [Zizania palustris]
MAGRSGVHGAGRAGAEADATRRELMRVAGWGQGGRPSRSSRPAGARLASPTALWAMMRGEAVQTRQLKAPAGKSRTGPEVGWGKRNWGESSGSRQEKVGRERPKWDQCSCRGR